MTLLASCEPSPDRHSAAPASAAPEPAGQGHVHLAATRIAEGTRAELDTLLLLDSARVRERLPVYLGHVDETLAAVRAEMTYFSMGDVVWAALADSVSDDIRAIRGAPDPYNLLAPHGDRFRRLLDHTEELHDRR
jgi:hypothetical protein